MTGKAWTFGQDWDKGPRRSDFFNGVLDEVAVWNRPLFPEEVRMLYAKGQAGQGILTAPAPTAR